MKLEELDDISLSRLIAESVEPNPQKNPHEMSVDELSEFTGSPFTYNGWFSPKRVWRWLNGSWQPCNMVTDPAMRDMLQQKLLEEFWKISLFIDLFGLIVGSFDHAIKDSFELTATRERLWAESFAKAHHLGADKQNRTE